MIIIIYYLLFSQKKSYINNIYKILLYEFDN